MEKKEYNGWHNYETWCVNLWLDNDQGSHDAWREAARTAYENAEPTKYLSRKESAAIALADQLKDETNDRAPDLGATVYADLLGAAMSEVNWHEIATALLEQVDE